MTTNTATATVLST